MFLTQSKCALAITRWWYSTLYNKLKLPVEGNLTNNSCSLSTRWGLNGYRDLRAFASSYLWTMPLYAQQCIQIEGNNHLKKNEQKFDYDLKVLFHCLESLDKFFLTDSGMLHPLIEISTGSGRTPTFSALFLTAESTDSLICSKGIICRPKHNCCFLPISSWTFFLKSHG